MHKLWRFGRRVIFLFRRRRLDRDLDEEMRFHLEMNARANRQAGLAADEAACAARREFGNVTLLKEVSREMWGWASLERLAQDLKYALRMLRKNPGFTAIAVTTLALGIGANTTVYSAISAVWFHPFPIPDADRLLFVRTENPGRRIEVGRLSWPEFRALRETSTSFVAFAVFQGAGYNLAGVANPVRISGLSVTPEFFATVGVSPALGRAFLAGEERAVILSHGFWEREFGGDRGILGAAVRLDGIPYTVVGVMPKGFWFPDRGIDVFTPFPKSAESADPARRNLLVIARPRPGVPLASAESECDAIEQRVTQQFPTSEKGWRIRAVPTIRLSRADQLGGTLLLCVVGAVLLIACLNVANLLLARAVGRERELAVRVALGATRFRLVRQIAVEGLVLSGFGAVGGLLLGCWGTRLLAKLYAGLSPLSESLSMDWRVLTATVLLTLLTALVVSLGPLWRIRQREFGLPAPAGTRTAGGVRSTRLRNALVSTEVTLAAVLLLLCGLLLRTLYHLQSQRLGFDACRILTVRVSPDELHYRDAGQLAEFYNRVLARISEQPGMQAAGAVNRLPTKGGRNNPTRAFSLEGSPESRLWAQDVVVTPGYFAAMGIPLLRGRDFNRDDKAGAPLVAIVGQTAAQRYWPESDPLGRNIQLDPDSTDARWVTVAGVAGDVRNDDASAPPVPMLYLAHAQHPVRAMNVAVRTVADPLSALPAVRAALRDVDRDQPVFDVRTMEQVVREDLASTRIVIGMLAVFAAVALTLAAIGIYGVISYSVRERTSEIGIRLALGARPSDVLRLVLGQGMRVVLFGAAAGLILGAAAGFSIRSILFGVRAADPATAAAVCALIVGTALFACYLPARRAAGVDPVEALRHE